MKFIKIFLLASSTLIIGLYSFILAVDPYEKYGFNLFNLKSKAVASGRENKFRKIDSPINQYEAFIIGASTAHRFETKVFSELTGLKAYNYSFQHSTPEDNIAVVKHIVEKQKPKMIFLLINFYALNTNFETNRRLFSSPLKDYLDTSRHNDSDASYSIFNQTYFTLAALRDSIRTILANIFDMTRKTYDENGNHIYEEPPKGPIKLVQFRYADYIFDEKRISYYNEIKRICDEKSIKLIVAISPLAKNHIDKIFEDKELTKTFFKFKKIAIESFGEIYDFCNFSINEYSTYPYFLDSTHPSNTLSTIMLKSIFSKDAKIPKYFGYKVDKDKLEEYIKNFKDFI